MFSRWTSDPGGTLACRLFLKHHEEINALYWSHMLAARRILSFFRKTDPLTRPAALFGVPAKSAKQIGRAHV